MRIFGRKKEEEEPVSNKDTKSKLKDLKPENKKKRKEPEKPWGKKERLLILFLLLISVLISILFSFSSGNFKIPKFPDFSLDNIFKGETVVIGNKEAAERILSENKANEIIKEFEDLTDDLEGIYAFEVIDLSSGFKFGINQNEIMQAASLIKLPLMLYSQGKIDNSKIELMGKRSDNTVFNELVTKFGKTVIQDYIASLDMKETSLEENTTTANEIADLFLKIYKEDNQKILDYLTDTIFEKWIRAGIPQDIKVSHKYGRETGVVNDAGIVYSQKPFVLVILSQNADVIEADKIIPELTEMIYLKHEDLF